jgi:uncharacterized protein YhaN
MKWMFPILLSLVGCVMLFSQMADKSLSLKQSIQELPRVNNIPQSVTAEIVRARTQILKQQDVLLRATELAKTDPAAQQQAQDEQRKLEEAQKAAAEMAKQAAPPPDASKFVSAQQRQHLMDLVGQFYQEVKQQAKSASTWEVALIIAGVSFGLVSAILSVFSLNKAAAVASAFVVVAGGAPKVYPIHERAVYYRTLTNQSYSLIGSLQIPFQMTAAEYDDGVSRLKVLDDYRATKYPETSDVDSTTQDLFQALNAVKTPSVEKP